MPMINSFPLSVDGRAWYRRQDRRVALLWRESCNDEARAARTHRNHFLLRFRWIDAHALAVTHRAVATVATDLELLFHRDLSLGVWLASAKAARPIL